MHTQTVPDHTYKAALARTDPKHFKLPAPDSEEEKKMLADFMALFETYTKENLSNNITKIYAENVYFRDAFRQFNKAEHIREYMLNGMAPLDAAEFEFTRVVGKDGEYYTDWIMRLDFKKTPPGTWEESIGMSHIRFNEAGKVIFHQDYWDPTDIVYKRIPIAKQLIQFVKEKKM